MVRLTWWISALWRSTGLGSQQLPMIFTPRNTIAFLLATALWLLARPLWAAGLQFEVPNQPVGAGDTFEVKVFLNTEGAELNAVAGNVLWPAANLSLAGIRDGGSLLSLWVEHPTALPTGGVHFAGVVPGGYVGTHGYLYSLILQAQATGPAAITASGEEFLLNDGKGTAAPVSRWPLPLQVVPQDSGSSFTPPHDAEPPEPFTPQLGRDPNIFGGQWFAAFTTQDKGSGLDHYEVAEQLGTPASPGATLVWQPATSPYRIHDQSLHSSLWVRAIDQAGNVRLGLLPAPEPQPWLLRYWFWLLSAILVLLIAVFAIWFIKHRNAKPTAQHERFNV